MKPSETRPGSFSVRAPDVSIEAQTRFQSASDADHGRRLTMIYMCLGLLRNVESMFRVGVINGEIDPLLQTTKALHVLSPFVLCVCTESQKGQ